MNSIKIVYKNWKNIVSTRNIIPICTWFGKSKYHLEEQWFIKAFDIDKNEERDFAMRDIERWND
jgi:hypothetical protein